MKSLDDDAVYGFWLETDCKMGTDKILFHFNRRLKKYVGDILRYVGTWVKGVSTSHKSSTLEGTYSHCYLCQPPTTNGGSPNHTIKGGWKNSRSNHG